MRRLIGAGLMLGWMGCGNDEVPPGARYAVVLVVDGLRTDECTLSTRSAITGVSGTEFASRLWKDVAPDGVVIPRLQNHGITITAPAHAQILTGRLDNFANVAVDPARGPGVYRTPYPTLFELVRHQKGLGKDAGVLIGNTELISPLVASIYPGLGADFSGTSVFITKGDTGEIPATSDDPVLTALEDSIEAGPPRLVVVNLHQTDRAGHYQDGPAYADAITDVDELIGDFWVRLKKRHPDYVDQLLFVVTADHGRHRHEEDSGFKNHGDGCSGCRDVPLFMAGGAVTRRGVVEGTWTQLDLSATLASWLQVSQPFGQGQPMSSVVRLGETAVPRGDVDVVATGGSVVVRRLRDDATVRSEIQVDGEVLSGTVNFAEAPALAVGQRRWACWRELSLNDPDWRRWTPRCFSDAGDGWQDIGFPLTEVGMGWRPSLVERSDGSLDVIFIDNARTVATTGNTSGESEGNGPRHARYTPGLGWTASVGPVAFLATDPSQAIVDDQTFVAVAQGTAETSRYDRQVVLYLVGDAAWPISASFPLDELLTGDRRVERPALSYDGTTLRLAMLGMDLDHSVIGYVESADRGQTWTSPRALPGVGSPYFYLSPAWDGRYLVWAEADEDGDPRACRIAPDESAPACIGLDARRIDSFSVSDGTITASVDIGDGDWTVKTARW